MTHQKILQTTAFALALGATAALAQGSLQAPIRVPLSDPGRPAVLEVSTLDGTIRVEGYDGQEILVMATDVGGEDRRGHDATKNGLRRIPNTSIGLTVEERDNRVELSTDWTSSEVLLKIQVPRKTSLKLGNTNGEDIEVTGVEGEHEFSHTNGGIRAIDVRGSVVANTTNGDIVVKFLATTPDKAMSFSSFNGDVDVTFPAVQKAKLRMKSGQGDIFTDFDIALDTAPPKVSREESRRGYRLKLEQEVAGTIGGGGPEMSFKTYNGDIYIRRGK